MKPYTLLGILFLNFTGTKFINAQVKITRIQIATDTTEITRKLLLQLDNKRFQEWVNTVSRKAESQKFAFNAPPLELFYDSFNFKINISELNDTTDISIQLQRKSIADASRVLAKVTLALSPSNALFEEEIINEISRQPKNKEGNDKKESNQVTRDTLVQWPPKQTIEDPTKKHVHHGTASIINLNLGLLQMQNFAGPSTTVMRYDEMPELNNAKTLNIGLEAMWGLNLYKGNLRLWYGISYDFYNYRFENNATRIDPNQSIFEYRLADANDPNELNPEKSKLVTEYIGIPLAISLENTKWGASKLRFMLGVKGGYLMNAYTKVKYYDDRVTKNYDDFHLNEISLQPFFKFQWDEWALFGKYNLTPISRNSDQNKIDPSFSGQKNMVIGMSLVID